jgi:hypothetical protein
LHELTLIFTDFYLEHAGEPAECPRLPGLETLLARGAVVQSHDWRAWIWRRIGLPQSTPIPVAALARQALPSAGPDPPGQWWLANCAHLLTGVNRVYLADSPLLSGEEWRELENGFNETFSAAGFRLLGGDAGRAFLLSTTDLKSDTADPARVRGSDILGALPTGPDAPVLKRLMTEIQMWLHQHPVNIARQERTAGMVNALWIWGGGQWPVEKLSAQAPALRSNDDYLRGLWNWVGGTSEPMPESFRAIERTGDGAMIVSLPSAPSLDEGRALARLDREWIQPALSSVSRGRLGRLQVHVNDRLVSLTRAQSWRWWHSRRPWAARLT